MFLHFRGSNWRLLPAHKKIVSQKGCMGSLLGVDLPTFLRLLFVASMAAPVSALPLRPHQQTGDVVVSASQVGGLHQVGAELIER